MKCLNYSQIISYQNKLMQREGEQKVQQHLLSCERCQKMLKDYQEISKVLKRSSTYQLPSNTANCYEEEKLLAFLEGGMKMKDQKNLYAHLANCGSCMDRLIALDSFLQELKAEGVLTAEESKAGSAKEFIRNLVDTTQQKLGSFWDSITSIQPAYRWAGIALLIIVVGFSFVLQDKFINNGLITREPDINQTQIQLIGPNNESIVRSSPLEFKWKGSEYFASYSFLILDSEGNIIWEKKTNQTRLTLPTEIQLQPSMTYFWQVEAFFENGGSVLSEMASFNYTTKEKF